MVVSPRRSHNRRYFYKYTSVKTALSILVNHNLRLGSPLAFNDPFDIPRVLKLSFSREQFVKGVLNELIRLSRDPGYDTSANLNPQMRAYVEWMRGFDPQHIMNLLESRDLLDVPNDMQELPAYRAMQKQWLETLAKTRILCVTEENDNPVMWNSYADQYRGVVLELECLDLYDSILLLATPVQYTDETPVIGSLQYWIAHATGQSPFDYEATFAELGVTKHKKWEYEREWRVISYEKRGEGSYSDYGMHPRAFSKVFLGKDIPDEDTKSLLRLIDHDLSHLEPYEMILDQDARRIVFRKVSQTT